LAGSAGDALTCKHVAPDYYLAIFGWEFRLPFFARSTVSKNVLPVSWAILFCGWAHKVCRQYVFKTYLPVIVPFFGVKFWPTNSAGNTVSKPAHVLLARFFVEILARFAGRFRAHDFCRQHGLKTCLPATVQFFLGIWAHNFYRQYGLKTCLPVTVPFFCRDLGPQFVQAVRFKNVLTCYCAIFVWGFGPTVSAGSTVLKLAYLDEG
jgi:hypothetical protein